MEKRTAPEDLKWDQSVDQDVSELISPILWQQNIDIEYRAQLLKKLPRNLKKGLERAFTQRFETKVVRPGDPPTEKGMEELDFWKKAVAEPDLRKVIDQGMFASHIPFYHN